MKNLPWRFLGEFGSWICSAGFYLLQLTTHWVELFSLNLPNIYLFQTPRGTLFALMGQNSLLAKIQKSVGQGRESALKLHHQLMSVSKTIFLWCLFKIEICLASALLSHKAAATNFSWDQKVIKSGWLTGTVVRLPLATSQRGVSLRPNCSTSDLLPAHKHGKEAEDDPKVWSSSIFVGNLGGVPDSWFYLGSEQVVVAIWGAKSWIESLCISPCSS